MFRQLSAIALIISALNVHADPLVGFTPQQAGSPSALDVVLSGINSAKHTVYVAAYSFTSKPVANALIAAAHRPGVKVFVIADQEQNRKYSVLPYMASKGVSVRINGQFREMHDKFMVIDAATDSAAVETGSFNYSAAAANPASNAENAILLRDKKTADQYVTAWKALWDAGQPVSASW